MIILIGKCHRHALYKNNGRACQRCDKIWMSNLIVSDRSRTVKYKKCILLILSNTNVALSKWNESIRLRDGVSTLTPPPTFHELCRSTVDMCTHISSIFIFYWPFRPVFDHSISFDRSAIKEGSERIITTVFGRYKVSFTLHLIFKLK